MGKDQKDTKHKKKDSVNAKNNEMDHRRVKKNPKSAPIKDHRRLKK